MKQRKFSILQRKQLADRCFEKTFRSMQLLHYTVLYYDFDFSKDDIKKFNSNVNDYNNECLDDRATFLKSEENILNEYGFSCEKAAKQFPLRAKLKIVCKVPNHDIALKNAEDAIEVCLVLFLHEFTKEWGKNGSDIALYWRCMKENAMNYANGMTDEFVKQYFKDELDLDITE